MDLITDNDVLNIENKLSIKFDEGSKEFIKCGISKDVQACPGAGKTTALVAKLDILASKMPFPDKSGILVLTHTNVAVNEIKQKLGRSAGKILGYPNHVGTFQSFINKYLAVPMYVKLFEKKPIAIDSNLFEEKLYFLINKHWVGKFLIERSEENLMSIKKFLESLEILDSKIILKQSNKTKTIVNSTKSFYSTLKSYLETEPLSQVMSSGYLTFDHCYEFAKLYLEEVPDIANIINSRFKFVFIDETQDTDDRQFSLLSTIFDNSDSVVQKIGDNDQSIFNFESLEKMTWDISNDHIKINNTKRLSPKICKVASNFSITQHSLETNNKIDIDPVVIFFEDEKINEVLPKFAEIVKRYNLDKEFNPYFKAIGSIGKFSNSQHTIPSYTAQHMVSKYEFNAGDDLLIKLNPYKDEITVPLINEIYWGLIVQYLEENNVKKLTNNRKYTKSSLINYLKINNQKLLDELKINSLYLIEDFFEQKKITLHVENSLILLAKFMTVNYKRSQVDLLIYNYKIPSLKYNSDKFLFEIEGSEIEINVSTIHKAKGETHTATLVLETYKNGYDINQLLPLLMNGKRTGLIPKKKLLYVGMTRPTHLLCLAVHKSHFKSAKNKVVLDDSHFNQISSNGFEIIIL